MRLNFTVEETDAILAKHYPWAVKEKPVSHLWSAKLNVGKPRYKELADKKKLAVSAFALTKEEAIADVIKFAKAYGYDEAT